MSGVGGRRGDLHEGTLHFLLQHRGVGGARLLLVRYALQVLAVLGLNILNQFVETSDLTPRRHITVHRCHRRGSKKGETAFIGVHPPH